MGVPGPHATKTLDRAWALDPSVSLRPERFGAMLYHFGTRRLSFIRDRALVTVLERLEDAPSARAACDGVAEQDLPAFERAIERLAATGMLREQAR